jgi:VIT1/CCC1 family predicted Fe2+/Mn2+ transporter
VTTAAAPEASLSLFVASASLVCLAGLGALAARAGGARLLTGALRVAIWGAFAMAVTAGIGWLFGVMV